MRDVADVHIGGLRIAYERAGSGPPLVLLHGAVSDHREWARQIDALSAEHTVVAWDAPGSGRSDDPPDSFRMHDYADVVAGLVDELGLARPHVLGLSWGSSVALELYRRHPAVPRSLVLVSAYAGWAGSLSAEEIARRMRGFEQDVQLSPEEFAHSWVPTLLTENAPGEMVAHVVSVISEYHPEGVRTILTAMAEADLRPVLAGIEVPTLLLYGEVDVRSPKSVAEDLQSRIPGARLVFIPGVGHYCNIEAAEAFNGEVRAFLAGA
jgi:pimeloyl-ACP methyl ester carboxylesterase